MRNISVRIILAVLLVASLGCAKVMNCKTEWFPIVKELVVKNDEYQAIIQLIRDFPNQSICGYIDQPNGKRVFVAIEKDDPGYVLDIEQVDGMWGNAVYSTHEDGIWSFGNHGKVSGYKGVPKLHRQMRDAIASDLGLKKSWGVK